MLGKVLRSEKSGLVLWAKCSLTKVGVCGRMVIDA